jgi:hypothetical protein
MAVAKDGYALPRLVVVGAIVAGLMIVFRNG